MIWIVHNELSVCVVCVLLQKGLKIVHHADTTLSSFCAWQKNLNPQSDTHPAHHDVAVLVTRQVTHTQPCVSKKRCPPPSWKHGMCTLIVICDLLFVPSGKTSVLGWTSPVRPWVCLICLGCVSLTAAAISTRTQDYLSPSPSLMSWATGLCVCVSVCVCTCFFGPHPA